MFEVEWAEEIVEITSEDYYDLISPPSPSSYYIKEEVNKVKKIGSYTKNEICLQKTTTVTQEYQLRKKIDGKFVEPAEYKNEGEIFTKKIINAPKIVDIDEYSIKLEKVI